jgi:hypothetical protein
VLFNSLVETSLLTPPVFVNFSLFIFFYFDYLKLYVHDHNMDLLQYYI